MGDIYVARASGMVLMGGRRYRLRRGQTTARAGHPILAAHGGMFEVLGVDFDVEQATAAPGERRNVQMPNGGTNQAIREWAAEHGYEVAPRGKLPAEVVEAYQQAHGQE